MKQELFGWLKDRKIFTSGGDKTLQSFLSEKEDIEIHKNDKRYGRRQKLNRKRNTR